MPTVADLQVALRSKNISLVKQLLVAGVKVNGFLRETSALSLAIYGGFTAAVRELLHFGADVNLISKDHNDRLEPPLYTACRLGNVEIVKLLLQTPVDVNKQDFYGHTSLWAATKEGSLEIVHWLLDSEPGPDFNLITKSYHCPLILASRYGRRTEIAKSLIRAGCNVNLRDKDGNGALYWTLRNKDKDIFTMLILAGTVVNAKEINLIGTTWGEDHVVDRLSSPPNLTDLCRHSIRNILLETEAMNLKSCIQQLKLPTIMKKFLGFEILYL